MPISLNNVNLKFVIPKDFITLVLMEKEPCPFLLDKKNGYGRRRRGRGSDCAFEQFLDWGLINIQTDSGVGKPHSGSNSFAIIKVWSLF